MAWLLCVAQPAGAAPDAQPLGWTTYCGSYANTRHSDLTQIRRDNVAALQLAWK